MKIDLTAKQNFVSESSTKKQQANAKILFGKKATKVLSSLEMYSKEKLVQTENINSILAALKSSDPAGLEKFAQSASGKKMASAALALANAKTPVSAFKAIKALKAPKSLLGTGSTTSKPARVRKIKAQPGSDEAKAIELFAEAGIPLMQKTLKRKGLIIEGSPAPSVLYFKAGNTNFVVSASHNPSFSKGKMTIIDDSKGDIFNQTHGEFWTKSLNTPARGTFIRIPFRINNLKAIQTIKEFVSSRTGVDL